MKRTVRVLRLIGICVLTIPSVASAQNNYLNAVGNPSFGVNIPIENGFINVSNGNLHMEFPLATHKQRGALALNERLVYDSRIWQLVSNGGVSWQPTNVPNVPYSQGGWRFVTGAEAGTLVTNYQVTETQCVHDEGYNYRYLYTYQWEDPSGATHPFSAVYLTNTSDCNQTDPQPKTVTGSATDTSGYQITLTGDNQNEPTSITIIDNNGTQVYPQVIDRFGNYWSTDANGNLVDDVGRTPIIVTTNGNVTYYDVLAPNGPINNNGTRVRYTVTTAAVGVNTWFNEPGVTDWHGTLNPVQSIQLPDGSSYTFTYDKKITGNDQTPHYGELTSVTLPTGGIVYYGWSIYEDSYYNQNRWLTSRTVGNNPASTFTPSVISYCSSNGTGCQEQVKLHKPSADETTYELTLNCGAWNTTTIAYNGSVAPANEITAVVNSFDFSQSSSGQICSGAAYVTQSATTTTLFGTGGITKTEYGFDNPQLGKPSSVKEWDYYTNAGSPPSTPTRETDYSYTGYDLNTVTVLGNGSQTAQTTYGYTSSATTTSGISQHGTQNAGGPYLQSVSRWLNTGSPSITTYAMDDTGQVLSTKDPNQNPSTNFSYQCANSLPYQTTNALNQTITYGYDCNSGVITSMRDPNDTIAGRSGTAYSYEGTAGRLQSVDSPDGGQTTYGYPSSTEVDATVLATPSPSISSQDIADSFGRKYQHIQAGVSSETTYDANGRIACVTNPHFTNSSSSTDGSTCIISYDGLDRPLIQQQPDGNTLQWSYLGNSTTSKDESGNQWVRTSNAFGILTDVVEPTGASTNYTYDGLGNLSTVNQLGVSGETPRAVRSFVHDSLSRLTSATTPEAGTIGYSYDANGNIHTKTAPEPNSAPGSGQTVTTTYGYDALNRLTFKNYSDGNWSSYFGYDGFDENGVYRVPGATNPIGRLTRVYNGRDSYQGFGYDAVGHLIEESDCLPSNCNEQANEFHASYNLAGNITSLTYPDGRVVTNGTDAAGHLQSVTLDNWNGQHVGYNYASVFTYTAAGAQTEVVYGNGVYIHTPYNNRQQMCQVWSSNSSQPLIDTHIYYGGSTIYCDRTPGNNGNVTQIKDWRNPNHTRYFGYDALNRINTFSNGDSSMQQSYSYDSFGNLSQSGTVNSIASFNTQNQINSGGYTYDAAGNVSSFNNGAFTASYSYNAENALVNVNNGSAGYITDGEGQRILKNVGNSWTEYLYFGSQLLAEQNSDGSWLDYIYANGQKIARADGADVRIHLSGNNTAPVPPDRWIAGIIPIAGGYTIKTGDVLAFRMYKQNANGAISIGFTDGSNSDWYCEADGNGDCLNTESQSGVWVNRVSALDASVVNKTISYLFVQNMWGAPVGQFDVMIADMSITSTDGTVTPFVTKQVIGAIPTGGGDINGVSGLQCVSERVINPSDAPGPQQSTTYYTGDQIGSARMLTSAHGWPASTDTFYPYGQEQNPTADPNHYKFAGLERDQESGLDHATFRQLSSTQGRWMSPDPYNGSMDLRYPQTLNRYAYVGNNPLGYSDPTGLDGEGAIFCAGGPVTCALGLGLDALIGLGIADLLSGPSFHGSLTPRPGQIWDEHGSFHASPYSSIASMIGDVNGLYPAGCEFGACGFQQSGNVPNVSVNCRGIETDHLGLILAQHCDATVSIGDGWLYSLSAGPIGDRLRGFVTKTHTLPTGATDFWKGRDGLGLAQCLIGAASASQASSDAPQYHPVTGPNSNIWLNGIFSSCGVNLGIKTHGPYF